MYVIIYVQRNTSKYIAVFNAYKMQSLLSEEYFAWLTAGECGADIEILTPPKDQYRPHTKYSESYVFSVSVPLGKSTM